jgi:adenine-specific DNA-methyltransferase
MDARGEIYWSPTGNPRRKIYLENSAGIPVQDIWMDFRDAHNQNIHITGYPTEKNPALLSRIIEASSNPGDLVLDCYAGSGTTLVVASELGRKWIGVDRSQEAITTILHRMANGSDRMGDFVNEKSKKASLPLFSIADFTLFEEAAEENIQPKDADITSPNGVLTIRSSGRAKARL